MIEIRERKKKLEFRRLISANQRLIEDLKDIGKDRSQRLKDMIANDEEYNGSSDARVKPVEKN